jgi:hypothetical protein
VSGWVRAASPAGSTPRVDLVERRLWVELVSIPPADAAALATVLAESARPRTGRVAGLRAARLWQ